jgi:hypothetical protein
MSLQDLPQFLIFWNYFLKELSRNLKTSKKYFHPNFEVPNFTHFKPIEIQRQFSQTIFQKLSYFKLVIFLFKTLKNYTKMWRAKKQKTFYSCETFKRKGIWKWFEHFEFFNHSLIWFLIVPSTNVFAPWGGHLV